MRVILQTERLVLREFTRDDVDNLFELNSDAAVMRYLTGGRPTPRDVIRDEIIPFHLSVYAQLDRLGTWAAESVATGEFLGWFHFRPGPDGDVTNIDLGYRLCRAGWNQGYATEGSRALIAMGFTELGVERVFAHTMAVNTASRRVLEKCGLRLVRTTPFEGPDAIEGSEHGEVEYAVTRAEWEARSRIALPPAAYPGGMHLGLVAIVVTEYDPAIRFFVDTLGFELVEDSPALTTNDGRPKRWVVVRPPGGVTGLLLARADGDEQLAVVGRQAAGRVGFFLHVEEFDAAYSRLTSAGVRFVGAPRREPYGHVAVFVDIAGNNWDLIGPAR